MPRWNWQRADWPHFSYDPERLSVLEDLLRHESGVFLGAFKHLGVDDKHLLTVELISDEALKTSEIEGEILNRDSVQSSIRRQFGLETDHRKIPPAEQGITQMMVNLYQTFDELLTHDTLFDWHRMLMDGRRDLVDIGAYRTHPDPMQVVSGYVHKRKIHFEAPPSERMPEEMERFIRWFNASAPKADAPLPALIRAGMAHLYFVCVHPFEDGNGRIGRAIAEKALAQGIGQPTLVALSHTIERGKKDYYQALANANTHNEITAWLTYFGAVILDAQRYTQSRTEFVIAKTRLLDGLRGQLNARQEKALLRMFQEGPEGFQGGLSAENYIAITNTSRATATRDLQELVGLSALRRTGERKSTRYHLIL